jgi:CRISPR-associated protein Cas1
MAWRGVHLTEPARLSLERGALKVSRQGEECITVPLEDLGWLIVDTGQSTMTSRLLSACSERGVCVVIGDEQHMPSTVITPKSGYHRQLTTVRAQMNLTSAQRAKLWQHVICRKIRNQAAALQITIEDGRDRTNVVQALEAMAQRVRRGDPENIEAMAAQNYWPAMFDDFVRRNEDDNRNGWLNYGYAVVRALLARELAALGFELSLGLHHASELNPHNLVDDVLEAFRPFVDTVVFNQIFSSKTSPDEIRPLDKEGRQCLAALPARQVLLEDESMTLLAAAGRSAATLRTAIVDGFAAGWMLPVLDAPGCGETGRGQTGCGAAADGAVGGDGPG